MFFLSESAVMETGINFLINVVQAISVFPPGNEEFHTFFHITFFMAEDEEQIGRVGWRDQPCISQSCKMFEIVKKLFLLAIV